LIHVREGASGMAVIAPHGRSIEPGTMELGEARLPNPVDPFHLDHGSLRGQSPVELGLEPHLGEAKGAELTSLP
jgi:hypothetical protein